MTDIRINPDDLPFALGTMAVRRKISRTVGCEFTITDDIVREAPDEITNLRFRPVEVAACINLDNGSYWVKLNGPLYPIEGFEVHRTGTRRFIGEHYGDAHEHRNAAVSHAIIETLRAHGLVK